MIAHLFVLKIEDHTIPKIRRRNSWHIISAPTPLANMSWGGFCTATSTIFQSPEALFVQKQGLTSFVGCNYMWDGWHSNVPVATKLYQHLTSTKCINYIHVYIYMYICSFTYTIICLEIWNLSHTHRDLPWCGSFRTAWWRDLMRFLPVPCRDEPKKAAGMTTWLPYENYQMTGTWKTAWGFFSWSSACCIEHDLEKMITTSLPFSPVCLCFLLMNWIFPKWPINQQSQLNINKETFT